MAVSFLLRNASTSHPPNAARYCTSLPSLSSDHTSFDDAEVLSHLIDACSLSSDIRTAKETHSRVLRYGYGLDPSIASSLISTYTRSGFINLSRSLAIQLYAWTSDLYTINIVLNTLMNKGEFVIARKVFDRLPARDLITWNSMIGGYLKNSRYDESLSLFQKMIKHRVEPSKSTFSSIMACCARLCAFNRARWIHGLMVGKGIELNPILNAALIDMYSKCGSISTASEIFERTDRDEASIWNAMIHGLAEHGQAWRALKMFKQMEVESVPPDSITYLGILKALSHNGLVAEGREFFDSMVSRSGVEPGIEHYGTIVDLLARGGCLVEAYGVIESMPMKPDIVVWRAFLSACRTHKRLDLGELAIRNISAMRSGDYVLLSNMLCSQARWDDAEEVRETMAKRGVRKTRGRSWVEFGRTVHRFKAGEDSHREIEAVRKVLTDLIGLTKSEGFVPSVNLVTMDISDEEKEGSLQQHSEKLALAFAVLKTSSDKVIKISKNLRICSDCHNWIKHVSLSLNRVIVVRDRIRFHRFVNGGCSCGDYW